MNYLNPGIFYTSKPKQCPIFKYIYEANDLSPANNQPIKVINQFKNKIRAQTLISITPEQINKISLSYDL